jgi:hypothetical protein
MLAVEIAADEIRFGKSVTIGFEHNLRVVGGGQGGSLPSGLGTLPVYRVDDYADRVPAAWRGRGGAFVPMYQCEAMWISFSGRWWKPNAVKVGLGEINAVTGSPWADALCTNPQDYVVVPDQPSLDGLRDRQGSLVQFVAPPGGIHDLDGVFAGGGLGCIQFLVIEPKAGRFPDAQPPKRYPLVSRDDWFGAPGLAGDQEGAACAVHRDMYGIETWDTAHFTRAYVHIVNTATFRAITGDDPPPTPITRQLYTQFGLPWLAAYDE